MNRLGVGVLLAALATPSAISASADLPTREEQTLLLEVGKEVIRQNKQMPGWKPKCVWYRTDWTMVGNPVPVSGWLLDHLRRYEPRLRTCKASDTGRLTDGSVLDLMLGPIYWSKPHTDATIEYDFLPVDGLSFKAHRDAIGRWHLTENIRE